MKKSLCLLVFLLLPCFASAQNTAPDPAKNAALAKIKEQAAKGGKQLNYDYLGLRNGVDAWLISGDGVMQMVYTVPNGEAAIIGGLLMGPQGEELSPQLQTEFAQKHPERAKDILVGAQNAAAKAAAPQAPAGADQLWQNLAKLGTVTYGPTTGAPELYVLLDPVQSESKQVWQTLLPMAEAGKITLHVAPLSILSADNIMIIAQALGTEHPEQSWKDVMAGKLDGLPKDPDPKGVMAMKANVGFAQALKLRQLPFIVYRQGEKGTVRAVRGLPKNWQVLFKDLGLKSELPQK